MNKGVDDTEDETGDEKTEHSNFLTDAILKFGKIPESQAERHLVKFSSWQLMTQPWYD